MIHSLLPALLTTSALALLGGASALAQDCAPATVCEDRVEDGFPVISGGAAAPIYLSTEDHEGVAIAAQNLAGDLGSVGGSDAEIRRNAIPSTGTPIIIGSIDRSPLIQALIDEGKLDVTGVKGVWEGYLHQVVEAPFPGVDRALVIAGADKRGTIYGIYDLSEAAGVSPWHFWADVPADKRENVTVASGRRTDAPAVKYRGIFINDENPALYGWVNETYGGFNADFYETVFDLVLRLKGNYLWPAMWGKALYDDDPTTGALADRMGIVIGTSHHEPLMRAHVEWDRYGEGPWDYTQNAETLQAFWRGGMERSKDYETLVTVGMRGDGDEAMTEGTAIDLLETIVTDQRQIIEDVTGKPASETPQIWALYKEVQDYYDQGMEVPDDVTLLFADDNWGNIRRLPELGSDRPGGYGVYYHFDYVGGPRSYRWINVTQIERVWEQMHLAHEYGANEVWITNVGDLKPMELPTDFFLDYAWDPADWPLERLPEYTTEWSEQTFGPAHATEIADLLDLYTKYNGRRTPELLDWNTYSLVNHSEFERVTKEYDALAERAEDLRRQLPERYRDAYLQLVWYPIMASANLYELYYATAMNHLAADQGRATTEKWAERARDAFERDAALEAIYHEDIAGGKWNHMMSQNRIGYTSWNEPPEDTMPPLRSVDVPRGAQLGLTVEGTTAAWPGTDGMAELPVADSANRQSRTLTLFNRGQRNASYRIESDRPWVSLSSTRGRVRGAQDVTVEIDWDAVPEGRQTATLTVYSDDEEIGKVALPVYAFAEDAALAGAVGVDLVSLDAAAPTRKVAPRAIEWSVIPNLGRTGSAITAFPVTADPSVPGGDAPHLAYDFTLAEAGEATVEIVASPSIDFRGKDGLKLAVSVDDGEPVMVNLHADKQHSAWQASVANRAHIARTSVTLDAAGAHTLKVWRVDPGVVLQKITVATGEIPSTYLGAPTSVIAEAE